MERRNRDKRQLCNLKNNCTITCHKKIVEEHSNWDRSEKKKKQYLKRTTDNSHIPTHLKPHNQCTRRNIWFWLNFETSHYLHKTTKCKDFRKTENQILKRLFLSSDNINKSREHLLIFKYQKWTSAITIYKKLMTHKFQYFNFQRKYSRKLPIKWKIKFLNRWSIFFSDPHRGHSPLSAETMHSAITRYAQRRENVSTRSI